MEAGKAEVQHPRRSPQPAAVSEVTAVSEVVAARESNLSRAEADVLNLIRRGHATPQIAARLQRTERTIEFYRIRIAMKLGISLGFGLTLGLGVRVGMMGVLGILKALPHLA